MRMTNLKRLAATACLLAASATSALAAVVISGEEVGGDVVFNLLGSYDVSAASFFTTGNVSTAVGGERGVINFGLSGSNTYDFYVVDIFPALGFGPGATFVGGDGVGGLFSLTRSGNTRVVGVAPGTTSGDVSGSLTFAGNTFAGLGLTEGVYDYAWEGDSAQIRLGVSSVPLPAGAPLLLAGLGLLGMIRKHRQKAA